MANLGPTPYLCMMGEAKQRENRRQQFLKQHPLCIYCGGLATTTDHCPPRCFFEGRHWPETYEFPACQRCNSETRQDEQALAVLVRTDLNGTRSKADQDEWQKLVRGVANNRPDVLSEWTSLSRNEIKNNLRRGFGREQGDVMRRQGWGVARIGPTTEEMITGFMVKLGKALYYRHNGHLFNGVLYIQHINVFARDTTPEFMNSILKMAPALASVQRNQKPLADQFIYRFNHSPEHQVMYAVVQFGDQFIFQLIAMGRDMEAKLVELRNEAGLPETGRHECYLDRDS